MNCQLLCCGLAGRGEEQGCPFLHVASYPQEKGCTSKQPSRAELLGCRVEIPGKGCVHIPGEGCVHIPGEILWGTCLGKDCAHIPGEGLWAHP